MKSLKLFILFVIYNNISSVLYIKINNEFKYILEKNIKNYFIYFIKITIRKSSLVKFIL